MKYFITCLFLFNISQVTIINKKIILNKENIELNKENVIKEIIKVDIIDPTTTYKSIMWESAHLKSNLTKRNNNITGMRCVKKRKTTQCGCKNGFGIYPTWKQCILDYKYYQDHNKIKIKIKRKPYYKILNDLNYDGKNYGNIINKIKVELKIKKIINGTKKVDHNIL